MIFLSPWALLGLLAASIPLLIHLFSLRKIKTIEFSNIIFLEKLQKTSLRKIKIKDRLLLLLRTLLIILIVLALSRPMLKISGFPGLPKASTDVVIIIDDSYSMSYVSDGGSSINLAKKAAESIVSGLGSSDRSLILRLSDSDFNKKKLSSSGRETFKSIETMGISYATGSIQRAIKGAAELLSKSGAYNREIFVISNFRKTALKDSASAKAEHDANAKFTAGLRLFYLNTGTARYSNVGISDLRFESKMISRDAPVTLSALVSNYSKYPTERASASLWVNGSRSAIEGFRLAPLESKRIQWTTNVRTSGIISFCSEIEDDNLDGDNRAYAALKVPDKTRIGLFADSQDDGRFVSLALETLSDRGFQVDARDLGQLSGTNLKQYSVVILIGSKRITSYQNIIDYHKSQGGLIIMPAEGSGLRDFRALLSSLRLPVPLTISTKTEKLGRIDFSHQMIKGLIRESADSPEIYRHVQFPSSGQDIIRLTDNSAFLSEFKGQGGRILLFNTPPVLSCTNFPYKSLFPLLITRASSYACSGYMEFPSILCGSRFDFEVPQDCNKIEVRRPDKSTEYIDPSWTGNKNFVYYRGTDLPGSYGFYQNGHFIHAFSANPDRAVSVQDYASFGDFKAVLPRGAAPVFLSLGSSYAERINSLRSGTEVWKILLLLALIAALAESLVSRTVKQYNKGKDD